MQEVFSLNWEEVTTKILGKIPFVSFIFLIIQTKSHSLGSVRSDLLIHMNLIYINNFSFSAFILKNHSTPPGEREKHNHDWPGAGPRLHLHPSVAQRVCDSLLRGPPLG